MTRCGIRYTRDLLGVAAPPDRFGCGQLIAFRATSGLVVLIPVVDTGNFADMDPNRLWDFTSAACEILEHCFTGPIEWAKVP